MLIYFPEQSQMVSVDKEAGVACGETSTILSMFFLCYLIKYLNSIHGKVEFMNCRYPIFKFCLFSVTRTFFTCNILKPKESELTIVYPEPQIGSEEEQLITKVKQNVRMFSISNWTAREGSHENR